MSALMGVPDVTPSHPGIDALGVDCRIDASVTVMRWGERADVVRLADGVSLYAYVRLVLGDVNADPCVGIAMGSGTIVNVGAYLSGEGGLSLGSNVLVGAHAKLLSAGHQIDGGHEIIARNRITRSRVEIGDGAWVGAGAVVLEGVRIGRGAVVAAGSVVRRDVPDRMIVAGVPARIIRARRSDDGQVHGGGSVRTESDRREPGWRRWLRGN